MISLCDEMKQTPSEANLTRTSCDGLSQAILNEIRRQDPGCLEIETLDHHALVKVFEPIDIQEFTSALRPFLREI